MFVSLLSSLSISQMTQFTNVGSGINKIIEPSVNTEIENWELELGEIKSKVGQVTIILLQRLAVTGAYIEHLNGFSSL